MIERFKKIHFLKDYIESKEQELEAYNREHNIDPSSKVNGRRLTNIGTYRVYIQNYLQNHPHIHKGLTTMVRQLEPGEMDCRWKSTALPMMCAGPSMNRSSPTFLITFWPLHRSSG